MRHLARATAHRGMRLVFATCVLALACASEPPQLSAYIQETIDAWKTNKGTAEVQLLSSVYKKAQGITLYSTREANFIYAAVGSYCSTFNDANSAILRDLLTVLHAKHFDLFAMGTKETNESVYQRFVTCQVPFDTIIAAVFTNNKQEISIPDQLVRTYESNKGLWSVATRMTKNIINTNPSFAGLSAKFHVNSTCRILQDKHQWTLQPFLSPAFVFSQVATNRNGQQYVDLATMDTICLLKPLASIYKKLFYDQIHDLPLNKYESWNCEEDMGYIEDSVNAVFGVSSSEQLTTLWSPKEILAKLYIKNISKDTDGTVFQYLNFLGSDGTAKFVDYVYNNVLTGNFNFYLFFDCLACHPEVPITNDPVGHSSSISAQLMVDKVLSLSVNEFSVLYDKISTYSLANGPIIHQKFITFVMTFAKNILFDRTIQSAYDFQTYITDVVPCMAYFSVYHSYNVFTKFGLKIPCECLPFTVESTTEQRLYTTIKYNAFRCLSSKRLQEYSILPKSINLDTKLIVQSANEYLAYMKIKSEYPTRNLQIDFNAVSSYFTTTLKACLKFLRLGDDQRRNLLHYVNGDLKQDITNINSTVEEYNDNIAKNLKDIPSKKLCSIFELMHESIFPHLYKESEQSETNPIQGNSAPVTWQFKLLVAVCFVLVLCIAVGVAFVLVRRKPPAREPDVAEIRTAASAEINEPQPAALAKIDEETANAQRDSSV